MYGTARIKTFLDENELTAEDVLADPVALKAILAKHVVAGTAVTAGEALAMDLPVTLESLEGSGLVVDTNDEGGVVVNGNVVVKPDLAASNGVIHGIDGVIAKGGTDRARKTRAMR